MVIKSGQAGAYDDDTLTDDDLLYRRVPDKPDFLTQRDPITGRRRPQPAAFSIKHEPDGLSVHVESIIRTLRLKTKHLCDWETHGVARFEVRHVRPTLGVIAHEDRADAYLGKAHALIRGPRGIPARDEWNPIRDEILAHAEFFEDDPAPSAEQGSLLDFVLDMGSALISWLRGRFLS